MKRLMILFISILTLFVSTTNAYVIKEKDNDFLKPIYKKIDWFVYNDYARLPIISETLEQAKQSYYFYQKNYAILDAIQKYIDNKRIKMVEFKIYSWVNIYQFKSPYDIRIVSTKKPVKFMYFQKDSQLLKASEVSYYYDYPYVVNGSYFGYGTGSKRVHAWLLKVMDIVKFPIRYDDANLTHVVRYNYGDDEISFIPNNEYEALTWQMTLEFQAWPQIISGWVIMTGCINSSWHWTTNHYRTLLAIDSTKRKYLIAVPSKVNLIQLSEVLLDTDLFKNKKIDIMNLDGGSSTSIYSSTYTWLNYNINTRLPIWLGIK